MDWTTAIGVVKSKVGNIPNIETMVGDFMELAREYTLEKDKDFLPWFLETEVGVTVLAGERGFPQPEGLIRLQPDYAIKVSGTENYIKKATREQGIMIPDSAHRYSLYGNEIRFNFLSEEDVTYTVYGFQTAGSLRTNPDNNLWLIHAADWLIAEAAYQTLESLQRTQESMLQKQLAGQARNRLMGETFERMGADFQ